MLRSTPNMVAFLQDLPKHHERYFSQFQVFGTDKCCVVASRNSPFFIQAVPDRSTSRIIAVRVGESPSAPPLSPPPQPGQTGEWWRGFAAAGIEAAAWVNARQAQQVRRHQNRRSDGRYGPYGRQYGQNFCYYFVIVTL